MNAAAKKAAKTVATLDATSLEVAVLDDGRFRLTSIRDVCGESLGSALAEVPLANVKFVRAVPPEIKAPCARAYATAHAETTNHCAARSFGCKFTVRGNSVGRHEQGCPLHLATVLLGNGSKIENFSAFFQAVEVLRGEGKVGSAAGFATRINKLYGSYAELLRRARKPSLRALDVIRGVLDVDDKHASIAEGMLNVARAALVERAGKRPSVKAKKRLDDLIVEIEAYFESADEGMEP